ncbi:hypothetical protein K7X08_030506 [Anisodus acutangulus]|uniref:Uncharacterized protein n=1 Tax=Anisodus acutangulus TaxID=402998 RepID=A0A9Q1L6Y2_9SOLA|nr:hypothetical protein K7X08_030506 [Anisodus acutangulus]
MSFWSNLNDGSLMLTIVVESIFLNFGPTLLLLCKLVTSSDILSRVSSGSLRTYFGFLKAGLSSSLFPSFLEVVALVLMLELSKSIWHQILFIVYAELDYVSTAFSQEFCREGLFYWRF